MLPPADQMSASEEDSEASLDGYALLSSATENVWRASIHVIIGLLLSVLLFFRDAGPGVSRPPSATNVVFVVNDLLDVTFTGVARSVAAAAYFFALFVYVLRATYLLRRALGDRVDVTNLLRDQW